MRLPQKQNAHNMGQNLLKDQPSGRDRKVGADRAYWRFVGFTIGFTCIAVLTFAGISKGNIKDNPGRISSTPCINHTSHVNRVTASSLTNEPKVFVGVLSKAANTKFRQAVRQTWGGDKRLSRVVFFTLRPKLDETFKELRDEAVQYQDILVTSEIYEHYYNITYAVFDIFKAAAAMTGITHVLKTDDDCYVRVPKLLAALQSMPKQWLYAGGEPMKAESVQRNPRKWHYVSYDMWASDKPVRYGYGLGYVLSIDLARYIAAGAPHLIMPVNKLLVLEDISVGYWVDHISKIHNITIAYDISMTMGLSACSRRDVVTHVNVSTIETLHCMFDADGACCDQARVAIEVGI